MIARIFLYDNRLAFLKKKRLRAIGKLKTKNYKLDHHVIIKLETKINTIGPGASAIKSGHSYYVGNGLIAIE